MDNISVPSRFSCLKIEDEDANPAAPNKLKKKSENSKQTSKKGNNIIQTNNVKKSVPKQVVLQMKLCFY